ncbi:MULTISPECIES: hypothetical protein [Mesobacillus]|uniref:Uncharacterized protein n=1 Tax=Mesobacillus selenatarsenatis TaxID=388741 RepID=A0A846TGK6_9BACI|nr:MULTISPECIES: hypothetical protein [Mesobacillus]NKE04552.1 hypothetical protein [Mesobacillus selenatarsenatis]
MSVKEEIEGVRSQEMETCAHEKRKTRITVTRRGNSAREKRKTRITVTRRGNMCP